MERPTSLRRLDRDLYCVDHDFSLMGVRLGGRTTVVRLRDGTLLLHSPGPLTDSDAVAIGALGAVRALLAPNLQHHVHLDAARRRWPEAQLLGPAALRDKRRDLRLDVAIASGDPSRDLPPSVVGSLEPLFVGGMPELDECGFLHVPSRTVILTDVAFHVCSPKPLWTQMFMRLNSGWNRLAPPRPVRAMVKDREVARAGVEAILARQFERVVVAHGDVLEQGGPSALRAGYDWLLSGRA